MPFISENLTDRNVGGSHEHGSDVELNCNLVNELASAAKSTAATCEHALPSPVMQVQSAVITYPSDLVITQTLKGGNDTPCECLTVDKNKQLLPLPTFNTVTPFNQPFTKKM